MQKFKTVRNYTKVCFSLQRIDANSLATMNGVFAYPCHIYCPVFVHCYCIFLLGRHSKQLNKNKTIADQALTC